MPNRILRDGILTSARVNALSPEAELFYRRLHSVVDDYARYFAVPMTLRAACYPLRLDTVRDRQIQAWLEECSAAGLLSTYDVNGTRYLELTDFRQQRRAKASKFPSPVEGGDAKNARTDLRPNVVTGAAHPQNAETKRGGNGADTSPLPDWVPAELFASWWQAKPRRARTVKARELALAQLEKFRVAGSSPQAVLEHCIRSGYAGLFAPPGEQEKAVADGKITCRVCGARVSAHTDYLCQACYAKR